MRALWRRSLNWGCAAAEVADRELLDAALRGIDPEWRGGVLQPAGTIKTPPG